ncbi:virion structural protein [Roseobacter phage RD-1410W1-01]|uniref:Virion protein n=1 Tax=Roseobacter phage RD-1410W1-01 TaxID=1815984 RepID=A0A191VYI6_9CAUD|nr:virion structural protein [Roseobacter phage RD-1410W1-01]ANJ20773.1 virion protein [Roseobacter phage RD-1410W1-01]
MADRRPIVLVDGKFQEFKDGDTLIGAGGGSASYPDFSSNAGKVLAVNDTEDGVEWVIGAGGTENNYFSALYDANVNMSTSMTGATEAMKGALGTVVEDTAVVEMFGYLGSNQDITPMIVKLSDATTSATITEILYTGPEFTTSGSNDINRVAMTSPVHLTAGDVVAFLWVRQDGSSVAISSGSTGYNLPDEITFETVQAIRNNPAGALPAVGEGGVVSSSGTYSVGIRLFSNDLYAAMDFGGGDASYPSFTGNQGKILAVNSAEDGVEWIDAPSGGDTYGAKIGVDILDTPLGSSSGFATKGNLYLASIDMRITDVSFLTATAGASFEVIAAIMDNGTSSNNIVSMTRETVSSYTEGSVANNTVALTTPLEVAAGQYFYVALVRTDGSATTSNGAYYQQNTSITNDSATHQGGQRLQDIDVQVGDGPSSDLFASDMWSVTYSYEPKEADTDSLITQETISGAYSIVEEDLSGLIMKKASAAATVTVTAGLSSSQPVTFIQTGAGQITFVADTGVTIVSADGNLLTRVQGSSATLVQDADTADTYYLFGDLTS